MHTCADYFFRYTVELIDREFKLKEELLRVKIMPIVVRKLEL